MYAGKRALAVIAFVLELIPSSAIMISLLFARLLDQVFSRPSSLDDYQVQLKSLSEG